MTEHPLLIFPTYEKVPRRQRQQGVPPKPHTPGGSRQIKRLDPKFARLEKTFSSATLALSPQGLEPEKALIFEIAGRIQDFVKAVEKISGLEWLSETAREMAPDDIFYVQDREGRPTDEEVPTRLYVVMADQKGARELLSLWSQFQKTPENPGFKRGLTKWRDLFKQLVDVRTWGPKDRLEETGLREEWEERLQDASETIRIEIELWFRQDPGQRQRAEAEARRILQEAEGQVISQCLIEGIHYHCLLVDLSIGLFDAVCNQLKARIVRCDQVMFLRPQGQMLTEPFALEEIVSESDVFSEGLVQGEPIIGILDGLPVENHVLLRERLIVDDPEDWAQTTPQAARFHGTAMASLVAHGDREAEGLPLNRPIYIRPVIYPDQQALDGNSQERTPPDRLVTDLIHSAVRRIVEGEGDEPPTAPSVRIINLSLGDPSRPFLQIPSPWARLLDYLAEKYQLLFIVSAGNYPELSLPLSRKEFEALPITERPRQVYRQLKNEAYARRLLSPAESLNAVTVGALHCDDSNFTKGPYEVELTPSAPLLPAPYSALGLGIRQAIKPELLVPGGRQNYILPYTSEPPCLLRPKSPGKAPGHRTACPNKTNLPGLPDATWFLSGSSNAAALATRAAAHLFDLIEVLRREPGGEALTEDMTAVMVKALLVHGASWSETAEALKGCFENGLKKPDVSRFLGYGVPSLERVLACTGQRATLLGCGKISVDEGHRYSIPLPPSLSGLRLKRRVTATLAWLSPVHSGHQRYRRAALELKPFGDSEAKEQHDATSRLGVKRTESDWQAVQRGTVHHEIFSGRKPTGFADGDEVHFQINCREDAGQLTSSVSYALAISFEVLEGIEIPLYQEIRERIRPKVPIWPSS